MSTFYQDIKITDGIDSTVWKAIEKSIDNNSLETFRVLNNFVKDILRLSIHSKSIKNFSKFIFFPAYIYSLSFDKEKRKPILTELHNFCSEEASSLLKNLLRFDIPFDEENKTDVEQLKRINEFYYWTFNGFSRLLYFIVKNGDIKQFCNAMDDYDQISIGTYRRNYDLETSIRDLERDNTGGSNDDIIKQKKEEYEVFTTFDNFKRHVIAGIKYWVIFLYKVKKLEEETAFIFIERLKFFYSEPENLLDDVLFFRGNHTNYMDWMGWDYTERPSGKTYSPPNPYDWLTFGFFVDQIRDTTLYISENALNSNELSQTKYLYDELKRCGEYLDHNFAAWKKILKTETPVIFKVKSDEILKVFAALKRKSITEKDREIANSALDQILIEEFKLKIGAAWKAHAIIHNLFKRYGNYSNKIEQKSDLKDIGQQTYLEKGKMMFTIQNHDSIYGTDQMGGFVGRWEDNHFFMGILQPDFNKVKGSNIVEIIDESIRELEKKHIVPDLILIPHIYRNKDNDLLKNQRFISKYQDPGEKNELSQFYIGKFDGIPMYNSFSDFLGDRILICNFKEAFEMYCRTSPDWYEEVLEVDVREITEDEVERKFNENQTMWMKTEDENIILTESEAKILIKTGVMINIWVKIEMIVLNQDAFIIGYLK